VDEDPAAYLILKLRADIHQLGFAIRQLQRAGLDDAAAQLLLARKRAMLESAALGPIVVRAKSEQPPERLQNQKSPALPRDF